MVFRLWTVYPAWRSICVRLQSSHMQPCNSTATQASICIKEFFEESAGRSALFEVVAALSRLTVKLRRRMEVFEERARVRAVERCHNTPAGRVAGRVQVLTLFLLRVMRAIVCLRALRIRSSNRLRHHDRRGFDSADRNAWGAFDAI